MVFGRLSQLSLASVFIVLGIVLFLALAMNAGMWLTLLFLAALVAVVVLILWAASVRFLRWVAGA